MLFRVGVLCLMCAALSVAVRAQSVRATQDAEFGPVVRAYLGYLRNEQEVVDDRASRHEVNRAYYLRNSNRIRALRQVAVRIAEENRNDYIPELEAVARDEMSLIFENPPRPGTFREGDVLQNTFRFLGVVRSGEVFYVFARLDPYEQADLMEKAKGMQAVTTTNGTAAAPPAASTSVQPSSMTTTGRPRRATP